jgi:hypothetical protein
MLTKSFQFLGGDNGVHCSVERRFGEFTCISTQPSTDNYSNKLAMNPSRRHAPRLYGTAIVTLVSFVNKFVHELLTVGVVKTSGTRPCNSKGRCRETIAYPKPPLRVD